VLKSMLPIVAAMMMGSLSKQLRQPGGRMQSGVATTDGLFGMLAPMLDSNRDGSMVDDVIGMLSRFGNR